MCLTCTVTKASKPSVQVTGLKKGGFVVKVDEDSLYFETFAAKAIELGLTREKVGYALGNYIIVGAEGSLDVIKSKEKPLGNYTYFKLHGEFKAVIKALESYAKINKEEELEIDHTLYLGNITTGSQIIDYVISVIEQAKPEVKKPDTIDAVIFNSFVKVGYTYCKINTTPCGIKWFTYDGENYRIRTNFFGINSLELI